MSRLIIVGILGLMITASLAPMVGGVNTHCLTGRSGEKYHSTLDSIVDKCNDELNDYYTGSGQIHEKYDDGLDACEIIMRFQEIQPQQLILACHGKYGSRLLLGHGDEDPVDAAHWNDVDGIKTGKDSWKNAAAPLSAILLSACESGKTSEDLDYWELFMKDLYAWVFMGYKNKPHIFGGQFFSKEYAEEITDGKKSYYRAYEEGIKKVIAGYTALATIYGAAVGLGLGTFDSVLFYIKDNADLDHDTKNDVYRKIVRQEGCEGDTLGKSSYKEFYFTRSFSGTSNGGYIVFHGIVADNIEDLTTDVDLKIEVLKYNGATWDVQNAYTTTWNDVKNTCNTDGDSETEYGGSYICSIYLTASFLSSTIGNGQIKFKVSNLDTSDDIVIDRFEYMEIGK